MGHRDSGRYPCQLVVMVTPETDEAVRLLVDTSGRSISDVLRETIAAGLTEVVRRERRARKMLAEAVEHAVEPAA